jgi:DNA-binding transcriptional LysR family regulator
MHEIDLRQIDLNLLVVFDVLMSERNVTRAAARLMRSQSAISHSLSRLREQLGDPLLVKLGGRMTPSPFAERLSDEVRPILRSIQRVLAPPEPFEPASSTRSFKFAASDLIAPLFPRLMSLIGADAPKVSVDWVAVVPQTLLSVAEGQVDLAFVASDAPLPEGLGRHDAGALEWATFVRAGHPAIAKWGVKEWSRWPHVQVLVDERIKGPLLTATQKQGSTRHIAARVLNFAAVGPLLAQTNFIATLPSVAMVDAAPRYALKVLSPPFPVPAMHHRFVWSERLSSDPASRWLRSLLLRCFGELMKTSAQHSRRAR